MSDTTEALSIRTATEADAPLVRSLMLAAFESLRDLDPPSSAFGESEADVAAAIARGGASIAYLGETPVGSVRYEPQETWLYIGRLSVIPEMRRRGIAALLMRAAESHAPAFGLDEAQVEMRSHLGGNRALFESLGYQLVWERPHPRNPAFTTVRMRKPLAPTTPPPSAP